MPVRTLLAAIAAALVSLSLMSTPAAAATVDQPLIVHVAPDGVDTNAGTAGAHVASINRANEIATASATTGRIEVRLSPGTYELRNQKWTYAHASSLTFVAPDGVAVFTGNNNHQDYLLRIELSERGRNITIDGLAFRNATNGLRVMHADNVVLKRATFSEIGNAYGGDGVGYAALQFQHVDGVRVFSPVFTDLINIRNVGSIHAVYIANDADNVRILKPEIRRVTGDPLRFRNGSDGFQVIGGFTENAGMFSAFSEFFNTTSNEARSMDAKIIGTQIGSGYDAPLVFGTSACFPSGSPVEPAEQCDILDRSRLG